MTQSSPQAPVETTPKRGDTNQTPREMLFEDINPAGLERRFKLSGYLLGAAINRLRGRHPAWFKPVTPEALADRLEELALAEGIIVLDEWHHAPACPSNNWHKRMMPIAQCSCGAAAARQR